MKCKISGCNNDMTVAGPPNARDKGMCWGHAVALADTLAKVPPSHILGATGIMPISEEDRLIHPLNREISSLFGGAVLKRLNEFRD
jgi:hypothetical protein